MTKYAFRHADKEFIQEPLKWPHWPILPLKRYANSTHYECSCIISQESYYTTDGPITVFHCSMYRLNDKWLEDHKQTTYASIDDLLADGWRVD